jgi:hypothetical protein
MTEELAFLVYEVDAHIKATKESNKKVSAKLTELKETLVITTGDNYVGSAEPQLREKMADLYSKIASAYDKPSAAELDNLTIIENRFEKAKTDFEKLKKKSKADDLGLKSYEDFLAE